MIQYRQWRTASDKLKLDLFDRRYKVLDSTLALLSTSIKAGKPTWDEIGKFQNSVLEARFLFRADLVLWLRAVESNAEGIVRNAKKANEISSMNDRSDQDQKKLEKLLDKRQLNFSHLEKSLHELESRFSPYLSSAHVKS